METTRTAVIIKPDCVGKKEPLEDLIALVREHNLIILQMRMVRRLEPFWTRFYPTHSRNPKFPDFTGFARWMASVPLVFVIIEGYGPNVIKVVREQILVKLREKYKKNDRENGFHASDSPESAAWEVGLIQDSQSE